MKDLDPLYERFKQKLEAVSGECFRVKTPLEASELVKNVLLTKGINDVALVNSSITRACDLINKLTESNIQVYTDQYRNITPTVGCGITEIKYAIAELGTLVQFATDVNERLCSAFVPVHIALVPTSAIIPTLMETMVVINKEPQIPGFVGFITGPSRTSDIERVLAIGVHGPEQLIAIFVDEQVGEAA